ncbi:MAG: hypothetical protein QOF57_1405 [Frankiaceae bacterium]|jgi:hypothetical protein|nr:hypothetical protein [Frankiaceae bacterium]
MLDAAARRRQRWLLFAGPRPLHGRSRRAGFIVAATYAMVVAVLAAGIAVALGDGAARWIIWPLALLGAPWSVVTAVTAPAWGGFSFSGTPDWLVVGLFAVPAFVNASIAGGLVARRLDARRRQRLATSARARS